MTRDRPYRKALSWEDSVTEITRLAGLRCDPAVVDAFLRCCRTSTGWAWQRVARTAFDSDLSGSIASPAWAAAVPVGTDANRHHQ
ncbi:hypothetical protein DM194_00170 [Azospirillum ramasamyi]|uniref:HD-GYP domain-containing protein n=1 Tax=Azospirillum ramasamyi TaxID=682998 RepID=A0A2U9S591_9PROT|nr:hypothetical protein DM194_00170 [Azospirillum ramasamyi]